MTNLSKIVTKFKLKSEKRIGFLKKCVGIESQEKDLGFLKNVWVQSQEKDLGFL